MEILVVIVPILLLIFLFPAKRTTVINTIHIHGTEPGEKEVSDEDEFFVLTEEQKTFNKEQVFKHIEEFPNGRFVKEHPEFVEEYLNNIDLDLPPDITTEK